MSRIALAVSWFVAVLAVAALWWSVANLTPVRPRQAVDVARAGPRHAIASTGVSTTGLQWTVVKQLSAMHTLVLEVETEGPEDAMTIARQLLDPVKGRYTEALVYFFRPGPPGRLASRRVQWTPRGGYAEMVFD